MKNTYVPKLGRAGNLQLRFDFLNLFNKVNLGPVNANMAQSNFGTVTTSLPAKHSCNWVCGSSFKHYHSVKSEPICRIGSLRHCGDEGHYLFKQTHC